MPTPRQQIRFCRSADGTRIAYATFGAGPPLLWVGHFARHLEMDWRNPVWASWLNWLGRRHTVIRYDLRGCGLSDRDVGEISLGCMADDFNAVVGAVGLDTFAFFGTAGNVAPAVAFAGEHAGRIEHLVLYGCNTRGLFRRPRSAADDQEAETRLKALELGWESRNAAFGQFFAAMHAPDATEHYNSLSDLLRATTSAANAIRIIRAYWHLDLVESLQKVRCPTLILHSRDDPIVPFEEGRLAASLVPDARFVPIDSRNHILVESEAGWRQLTAAVDDFLPASLPVTSKLSALTLREREILEAVARGQGNQTIAKQLGIAEKTVRNHVSIIFDKLGAGNRSEAIVIAREGGFGR